MGFTLFISLFITFIISITNAQLACTAKNQCTTTQTYDCVGTGACTVTCSTTGTGGGWSIQCPTLTVNGNTASSLTVTASADNIDVITANSVINCPANGDCTVICTVISASGGTTTCDGLTINAATANSLTFRVSGMSGTAKTGQIGTVTCPQGNFGQTQRCTIIHEVGGGATALWSNMTINAESAFNDVGYTCNAAAGACGSFTMNCKETFNQACSILNNAYTTCNGDLTCNTYSVTQIPTNVPSKIPTSMPSVMPTLLTKTPTNIPSVIPTKMPSQTPSITPTSITGIPTKMPTMNPSVIPTTMPTVVTGIPTVNPSITGTYGPTLNTKTPSKIPTSIPSMTPTSVTGIPTAIPTITGTGFPTIITGLPTVNPTINPTVVPTLLTVTPTSMPSIPPTKQPTNNPTLNTITPTKATRWPSQAPSLKTEEVCSFTLKFPTTEWDGWVTSNAVYIQSSSYCPNYGKTGYNSYCVRFYSYNSYLTKSFSLLGRTHIRVVYDFQLSYNAFETNEYFRVLSSCNGGGYIEIARHGYGTPVNSEQLENIAELPRTCDNSSNINIRFHHYSSSSIESIYLSSVCVVWQGPKMTKSPTPRPTINPTRPPTVTTKKPTTSCKAVFSRMINNGAPYNAYGGFIGYNRKRNRAYFGSGNGFSSTRLYYWDFYDQKYVYIRNRDGSNIINGLSTTSCYGQCYVTYDNHIYMWNNYKISDLNIFYDIPEWKTNWNRGYTPTQSRGCIAVDEKGGIFYFVGDGTSWVDSMQGNNVRTLNLTKPHSNSYGGCLFAHGYLYIFGGSTSRTLYRLNTANYEKLFTNESATWETVGNLYSPSTYRSYIRGVVVGQYIYFVGGRTTSSLSCYDIYDSAATINSITSYSSGLDTTIAATKLVFNSKESRIYYFNGLSSSSVNDYAYSSQLTCAVTDNYNPRGGDTGGSSAKSEPIKLSELHPGAIIAIAFIIILCIIVGLCYGADALCKNCKKEKPIDAENVQMGGLLEVKSMSNQQSSAYQE